MNITVKRILCMVLVVCLMFTMTGCAEGVGAIFGFAHRLFVGLGNLAVAGIAYVVEFITYPIFERTGWCGCSINAGLFRGFNRIVNPSGDIIPWQELTKEDISFHYEHEEYLAAKEAEEEAKRAEGGLPVTGGADRFLSDGKLPQAGEMPEDSDTAPYPEGVEPKSNFWGDIFFCSHELTYSKSQNLVKCRCGANKFTGDQVDWNYDNFAKSLPRLSTLFRKKENKEKYGAECYLKFKGVNDVFFKLMEYIEEEGDKGDTLNNEETLKTVENLTKLVEKVELGHVVYRHYNGTSADLLEKTMKFDSKLGDSLEIVGGLIQTMKMIENQEDTNKACMEFIETVKVPVSAASGNLYLMVGMDSMKIVVDAYLEASESYKWQMDYHGLLFTGDFDDGQFQNQWEFLLRGEQVWNQYITVDHILGTGDIPGLKLPNLEEIVRAYPDLSDAGKLVADEYILYCMNYVFQEALGISYQDYVNFLGENGE